MSKRPSAPRRSGAPKQALELMDAGGPVTFVTAWIEREAKDEAWSNAATAKQQGDLFQWGEAQAEVGKRQMRPKSRSPKPKARAAP